MAHDGGTEPMAARYGAKNQTAGFAPAAHMTPRRTFKALDAFLDEWHRLCVPVLIGLGREMFCPCFYAQHGKPIDFLRWGRRGT